MIPILPRVRAREVAMAANATEFYIAILKARGAVLKCMAAKLEDFLHLSHSPYRTIDEVTERWEWYNERQVDVEDAWFRAIHSKTMQEVQSTLLFDFLDKDMKDLESETSKWVVGQSSVENIRLHWESVVNDVMLMATRIGAYLLVHHRSRNGVDEGVALDGDHSREWNTPKESDTVVVAQLRMLRGNTGPSLPASIKQVLQLFAVDPSLGDEFNSNLDDFLAQLKLMDQMVDALLLFSSVWPPGHVQSGSDCRSSVCRYVNLPPADFGRARGTLIKAWMDYHKANESEITHNKYSLWKMTWQHTFVAVEMQYQPGSKDSAATPLRDLFRYNVAHVDENDFQPTPKRRSRAQIIAVARARKNPALMASVKPKASSSKDMPVRSLIPKSQTDKTNDSHGTNITVRIPKPKLVGTSSSSSTASNQKQSSPHSHSTYGWNDAFTVSKPSQFGDDILKTPRAEPKQKTRGTPNPALAEEPAPNEPEPDLGTPTPEALIFTDPKLYDLIREIFPLTAAQRAQHSHPEPTGSIKFTELQRLLRSPPLNFKEIHIGMPECKWETPSGKGFSFHTPHKKHGGWIEGKLLKNMREGMRRSFGWSGEEFVLDEGGYGAEEQ